LAIHPWIGRKVLENEFFNTLRPIQGRIVNFDEF